MCFEPLSTTKTTSILPNEILYINNRDASREKETSCDNWDCICIVGVFISSRNSQMRILTRQKRRVPQFGVSSQALEFEFDTAACLTLKRW